MDDSSNCEAGVISFPDGKAMSGQAAQGLYEIMLCEEFAKMNELTRVYPYSWVCRPGFPTRAW
jgi:hypothetical protein